MSFSTTHDRFDSMDCDLIAYLAARVGVSEPEALERLGACLIQQNPALAEWSDGELQDLDMHL